MDIRQLKLVLAVADAGSIFGAAEQLYLSRPGVSKSIAQLEKEIGVPLFERGADGVRLTDVGRQILPEIRKTVENFDALERNMQDLKRGAQTVRLGFAYGTYLIFMDALQEFEKRHGDIVLEIEQYQYEDILPALKSGRLDLVCSGYSFQDVDLDHYTVHCCETLWGVRSDSPMAKRGYITDEEIARYPHCIPSGSRRMDSGVALSNIADRYADGTPGDGDRTCGYVLNDNMFYLCKVVLQEKGIMAIGREALPVAIEGITFLTCPQHSYYWKADLYYSRRQNMKKAVRLLMEEVFPPCALP